MVDEPSRLGAVRCAGGGDHDRQCRPLIEAGPEPVGSGSGPGVDVGPKPDRTHMAEHRGEGGGVSSSVTSRAANGGMKSGHLLPRG